jgi:AcrR family transcriptional regulator
MATHTRQRPHERPLSPSRRTRRAADIRERLYRSALGLFAERGYFATTVEDITEAADLGKGTFFNYFPSKEHVLSTFGDQRLVFFERALDEVRSGKSSAADALASTIAQLTTLDQNEAGLFRSIFAAHACSESVRTHYRERIGRCQRIIATILNIGQTRGDVRSDRSAAEMARIMQQTFMGLTMAWAMNPEEQLARLSHEVWSALWESFRTRKAGNSAGERKNGKGDLLSGRGKERWHNASRK